LRSLSLDLESLRRVKSDIILTTVTAFGAGGPWSHKHGFDGIGQVMSGAAYMTGTLEQPYRAAVAWVDCGTASLAAFGTLAALMERQKSAGGKRWKGRCCAPRWRSTIPRSWSSRRFRSIASPPRIAGRTSAPSDLFRTRDGWIIAYAIGNPMFARWAKMMGEDGWLTDPRFKDDEARGNHAEDISKRVSEWMLQRTTEQALTELEGAKIPPARSTRHSRRSTTRTSARPACSRTRSIQASRVAYRSRRHRWISRTRRGASGIAHRCSASTRT